MMDCLVIGGSSFKHGSEIALRDQPQQGEWVPMISYFRVQNYKALKDVTLSLTPLHLLIGPNDSGKTSLLETLAAFCRSVDMPLEDAFPDHWEGTELVTDGDRSTAIAFDGEDEAEEVRYYLEITFSEMSRLAQVYTEEIHIGKRASILTLRDHLDKRSTAVCRHHANPQETILKDADSRVVVGDMARVHQVFSPVHFHRWNARLLATPCALDTRYPFRIHSSGFGLARVLDDLLGYDRIQFSALETRFRRFFPEVATLRLVATEGRNTYDSPDQLVPSLQNSAGKGIYVRFHGHDTDIPARQLSEGMILVLGYLAVLYSPQPPRLLLIEEPENGIHPSRLKEIIGMLRELIQEHPETQVVLTTHSPYLVDQFSPEEVTLCHKGPDGHIRTRRLSESSVVQQQQNIFSLGEIWPAEEEAIVQEMEGLIIETGQPS